MPRGEGGGRHYFEGARALSLPTNVPVPESLQKVELRKFKMKLEICIDVEGRAKIRLMESCGSCQLDQLVIQQLLASPWSPATLDGRPQEAKQSMILTGDYRLGTQTFSIVAMDKTP